MASLDDTGKKTRRNAETVIGNKMDKAPNMLCMKMSLQKIQQNKKGSKTRKSIKKP